MTTTAQAPSLRELIRNVLAERDQRMRELEAAARRRQTEGLANWLASVGIAVWVTEPEVEIDGLRLRGRADENGIHMHGRCQRCGRPGWSRCLWSLPDLAKLTEHFTCGDCEHASAVPVSDDPMNHVAAALERLVTLLETRASEDREAERRRLTARYRTLEDQYRRAVATFQSWERRAEHHGRPFTEAERADHHRAEAAVLKAEGELEEFRAAHPEITAGTTADRTYAATAGECGVGLPLEGPAGLVIDPDLPQ